MSTRLFDIAASALGILGFSPLFLLIAAAVKLQDGGPILFKGKRVGRGGRIFHLYKFRSMVVGADNVGAGITVNGDRRITKLGRLLRNTKLDELPQLFNVLKGDMSFVGPRPEDPRYVDQYTEAQRLLLAYRPGITSPASLKYRSEEALLAGENSLEVYNTVVLPRKLLIELGYLRRRSLWSDIDLILQTLRGLKSKSQAPGNSGSAHGSNSRGSLFSLPIFGGITKIMIADLRPFLLSVRNRHLFILDLLIFATTPTVALVMRLNGAEGIHQYVPALVLYTLVFLGAKPLACWAVGLYNRFWPYASVDALKALCASAIVTLIIEVALSFGLIFPLDLVAVGLPHSIPLISAAISILIMGSTRLAVRMLFELSDRRKGEFPSKPVVIAGAGVAGALVVKELRLNPQVGLRPVAFLDDDPQKLGARIHDIPVAGCLADLQQVVSEYEAEEVIIAMPKAPGRAVRDVVLACKKAGIPGRTVPGFFELLSGTATVSQIRTVQVEDLLRRGTVSTDPRVTSRLIHNKRVMVTGAGGSIGSELCRQIALFGPSELILLGHGENSIFKIANNLKDRLPTSRLHSVIADIRDKQRMNLVFHAFHPEVIFHAAAHKHVGLMQSNVPEAITNNVLGTRNLLELSDQHGVERFVMISSDKAVNPTTIMGVTKRMAEILVHDAAMTSGKSYLTVRFGNVLGSRGSVVPIFKAQIAAGGPVTVSDPRVTRFFMTIPEAVQLVLQAGAMGAGGEVFVLDMGEPVKILDLAKDVIRLSGLQEGRDIEIEFTGLTPGEKLHEELYFASERPVRSAHEKIFVCPNGVKTSMSPIPLAEGIELPHGPGGREGDPVLRQSVDELVMAVENGQTHQVQELIKRIVPEYRAPEVEANSEREVTTVREGITVK